MSTVSSFLRIFTYGKLVMWAIKCLFQEYISCSEVIKKTSVVYSPSPAFAEL